MFEPIEKKPSRLLVWAAHKFAKLDDKQMVLLPPDRWVIKNFREAVMQTAGGNESLDKISSGLALTGAIVAGGVIAMAIVGLGMPALAIAGMAASAAGLSGVMTGKIIKEFRRDILPEAGKNMSQRFLTYQAEKIKCGWQEKFDATKAKRQDDPQAALPKIELKGVFAKLFKARDKAALASTLPSPPTKSDKGARP